MIRPIALVLASTLFAAPKAAPPPRVPARPLPFLPSIPRVRVEVSRDHVVVTEEIDLPRGDWSGSDLELFVAFGGPGAPEAMDARLFAVADGALEPDEREPGSTVPLDFAPVRPSWANTLIGSPQMAGAVLHVDGASFRRATAPGGMAAVRVRSLLPLPPEDAATGREVVVRLGASNGVPLTLGVVQVTGASGAPAITYAEAHLCGANADPWPLAVTSGAPARFTSPAPVAPVLAVRHSTDDLCVRFWPS